MSKPVVAANKPIKVELTAGEENYFCTCGRSSNQPYCDGSHAGTGFKPKAFTAEESGDAYLCRCKHTQNPPFCDGALNSLLMLMWAKRGLGFKSKPLMLHRLLMQPKKSQRWSLFIS